MSEGVSAIVVGAFCEHNDQVHSLVNLLAAKAGPGAETETGLDNKSAVAFEKHRIRLRMAAGAWRDYHESIHARLPFVHSYTADAAVQEDLRRADERQERAARNLVQSPSPSVRQGRGTHRGIKGPGTPGGGVKLAVCSAGSEGIRGI